jgi:ligand-binding SRPBCC domain-containing protein
MRFQHRFRVDAPLADVAEFHSNSASMAAITPPPIIVQVHQAPVVLQDGDEMDFTLWLGPLPLRWLARIEDVTARGFVDRQVRGPMQRWEHRHSFVPSDDGATEVVDVVEVELRRHLLWGPLGLGMWLGLPILFAFRGWKTRKLLQCKVAMEQQTDSKPSLVEITTKVERKLGLPQYTVFVLAAFIGVVAAFFLRGYMEKRAQAAHPE